VGAGGGDGAWTAADALVCARSRGTDATTLALVAEQLDAHSSFVLSVAFSSDGRRIVSGSGDMSIKLWGGRVLFMRACAGGKDELIDGRLGLGVFALAWCADASTLALVAEKASAHSFPGSVNSVGFSPDGTRIVSGGSDRSIKLWGGPALLMRVVVSSPGPAVVVAEAWVVVLLCRCADASTLTLVIDKRGLSGAVSSVGFSPDGRRVVSGSESETSQWNTGSIKLWGARALL
jgi:WD40 repeat protein